MIFAQQLADLIAKLQSDRAWQQQTVFFDQTADLVLDISTNGHEPRSRDEYRAGLLTFLALDLDLSIPTNPHRFGKTPSIILIALVHAYGQSRVGMPRVDANHREIDPTKFMP
jgi:hypothetical protein